MEKKKVKTLAIEKYEWEEEIYLFGIYSSIEIFKVIYHLNSILKLQLKRQKKDINLKGKHGGINFPLYHFFDENELLDYYTIPNRGTEKISSLSTSQELKTDLFDQSYTETVFLLPELKRVDYLIAISGGKPTTNFYKKLRNIKYFSWVNPIDLEELSSYQNIIFN